MLAFKIIAGMRDKHFSGWVSSLPLLPQPLVDGVAGFGDALLFEQGQSLRDLLAIDGGVNQETTEYKLGYLSGFIARDAAILKGGGLVLESLANYTKTSMYSAKAAEALRKAKELSLEAWEALPSGGWIIKIGDVWVKRASTHNPLMNLWQKSQIKAQAEALEKLGEMAPKFAFEEGIIAIEDVGTFTGTTAEAWKVWWDGSKRLGTIFNDIRPRNIGSGGVIFDPAKNFTTQLLEGITFMSFMESLLNIADLRSE